MACEATVPDLVGHKLWRPDGKGKKPEDMME